MIYIFLPFMVICMGSLYFTAIYELTFLMKTVK